MPTPTRAPADALAAVASQVIADNADVADQAKKIVRALLTDIERTIRIGDTAQKAIYVRAILPSLLRAMQDRNDGGEELQAAFDRVMSAVRGDRPRDSRSRALDELAEISQQAGMG